MEHYFSHVGLSTGKKNKGALLFLTNTIIIMPSLKQTPVG
jgi:hypothetical protein